MVFRGTFQNGKVVLDEPAPLPDGTRVDVRPAPARQSKAGRNGVVGRGRGTSSMSVLNELMPFVGKLGALPPDASRNVDHYLYGARKISRVGKRSA